MKILFSPSENKSELAYLTPINKSSFIFAELFDKRLEVIKLYNDFVKYASINELQDFFELKSEKEVQNLQNDLLKLKTCEAIKRYKGVAYDYLDFESLDEKAQNYVYENTLIFSNLFGVVQAKDHLPLYKLKQGAKIKEFDTAKFYKTHFSKALDEFLQNEEIIDLRAGFYEKFYTLKQDYTSYKFLKNNKVVSHFAKAYRGILLRTLACFECKSNQDLLTHLPHKLSVKEIKKQGLKQEIVLEIKD
ncbi:peroxide stress protein YaaA [Campylobacter sp. MIT 19-121]|uniref:YaaA family protein n=1 Tax=Campylobacter sp. MIT 19-121 TaxID=2703906 RepID=UPI00138A359B|nr:peroxide stress protein YaaA [Campylobacter sp. MIT 19-121]NDJ27496.1 peroxide stress protein YaaA [Campylobacter sp. MIT 19-121]